MRCAILNNETLFLELKVGPCTKVPSETCRLVTLRYGCDIQSCLSEEYPHISRPSMETKPDGYYMLVGAEVRTEGRAASIKMYGLLSLEGENVKRRCPTREARMVMVRRRRLKKNESNVLALCSTKPFSLSITQHNTIVPHTHNLLLLPLIIQHDTQRTLMELNFHFTTLSQMGFVHLFRNKAAIGLPRRDEVCVKKLGVDLDVGRWWCGWKQGNVSV